MDRINGLLECMLSTSFVNTLVARPYLKLFRSLCVQGRQALKLIELLTRALTQVEEN